MIESTDIIPVFLPEEGCKNRCIFCNQHNISGKKSSFDYSILLSQIHKYAGGSRSKQKEVAFYGGNFTGIDMSRQKALLEMVQPLLEYGVINAVRISTRPDAISQDILDFLSNYGVRTIELGIQSFDDGVLKANRRNYNSETAMNACRLIKKNGFRLGIQLLPGLLKDTAEKSICSARLSAELKADMARIYPALVIKDTELEKLYQHKLYEPLSLDEAVELSARMLLVFENSDIPVIKLGLHPSEGLISRKNLAAGPFHPNFRELVLSYLWRQELDNVLTAFNPDRRIKIEVNASELNYAVGYQSVNRKYLLNRFKQIHFQASELLPRRSCRASYY